MWENGKDLVEFWWDFSIPPVSLPRQPLHAEDKIFRVSPLTQYAAKCRTMIDPPTTLDVMPPQGTVHRKAVPLQCPPTSNIAHKDCCVHPNSVQIPEAKVASEAIQRGKQGLLEPVLPERPRTTSPLERAIKELRRRIRPMDGFGSQAGATNFLRAWMIKENVRSQGQDWLEAFMA